MNFDLKFSQLLFWKHLFLNWRMIEVWNYTSIALLTVFFNGFARKFVYASVLKVCDQRFISFRLCIENCIWKSFCYLLPSVCISFFNAFSSQKNAICCSFSWDTAQHHSMQSKFVNFKRFMSCSWWDIFVYLVNGHCFFSLEIDSRMAKLCVIRFEIQ